MDEFEKQYPMADDALYDMYYYDDQYGVDPQDAQQMNAYGDESDEDAFIFNSNDLANRIWEDND